MMDSVTYQEIVATTALIFPVGYVICNGVYSFYYQGWIDAIKTITHSLVLVGTLGLGILIIFIYDRFFNSIIWGFILTDLLVTIFFAYCYWFRIERMIVKFVLIGSPIFIFCVTTFLWH